MIRSNLVNQVLEIVGDNWVLQIVAVLMGAPHRFDQIVVATGVPRSTLATRLRRLIAAKCMVKQDAGGAGAGALASGGYSLTAKGSDLLPILQLIRQWNRQWGATGSVFPDGTPVNACGHGADVEVVCACCGRPAEARDMKVFQTSTRPIEARLPGGRRARTTDIFSANGDAIPAEVVLGDRWAGLIMAAAFFGATKYSDIEAALGIATNILAVRLDWLTRHDLLSRERYQSNPPRHAYHLTQKGLSLYPIIVAMDAWAWKWLKPHADLGWRVLHKPCSEWFVPRIQCARCEAELL